MRVRKALSALVAMVILASCGTESSAPATTTANTLAARVLSLCTQVPAADLGKGTLCIDNGFRLRRDDFSFSNWGRSTRADDNVTAQTLIDLFGYDTVCIPGDSSTCVMRPTAEQILERWNTALAGGRCEGLATLSARLFLSLDHPQQFTSSAQRTSDISSRDSRLSQSTVYWWATQFIDEVARAAQDSRRKSPLVLVDELIHGLANSLGHTLGLYFGNQGHSVTPFAVTRRGDNFVIHVYDNNFPGRRREVLVNMRTNSWLYINAMTSVDGSPIDWAGSTGTMELTSMSARQGPFTCPFCKVMTDDSPTIVSLTSRDPQNPGYLSITSGDGKFEMSPNGIANTIDGAAYTVSKGGPGMIRVELPSSLDRFDIAVSRESRAIPAGDVVMSVERHGFARIQVTGNLAHGDISSASAPILRATRQTTTVKSPQESAVSIKLARGGTLATHTLDVDSEFVVSRVTEQTIDISVKGLSGQSKGALSIAPFDTSERVDIRTESSNDLAFSISQPTAIRARAPKTVNFLPTARPKPRQTTTTTVPTIEISEPD